MDWLQFARSMGALCAVLAILAGALVVVRRYDIALPGRVGGGRRGRVGIVERVTIDGKRSLLLICHDAREHLILMTPEGHLVLDRVEAQREAPLVAEPAFPKLVTEEAPDVAQPSFAFEPWLEPADLSASGGTVLRFARRA